MSAVFDQILAAKTAALDPQSQQDMPASLKTPEHIQKALRELILKFETESDQSRREYVRRCLKNHEFFRGNQYLWWDPRIGAYRAPTQTGGLLAGATPQQAQNLYTINIFQGFAMATIAILTANHPTVRFFPMRADDPGDRESANGATDYVKIFERQSKKHQRLLDEVYTLWCDGSFGSFVHTVADGDRYGWIEQPVFQQMPQQVGPESYKCMTCGAQSASLNGGTCAACGTPYTDASIVPPQTIMKNVQTGTKKVPRSRVIWDIVGGLELKLPPNAKDQPEFPYIIRSRELHKAYVRRAYPEIADRIVGGGSGNSAGGDSVERKARRQLAQGLTVENRAVQVNMGDEVTFKEAWFRPWAFYQLDEAAVRDELLKMYPDGCYVAFSEDVFCEGRGEKIDDHWRICHALPGRGQVREPIGGSLTQLQEITNDLYNIVRDSVEFTLPATFVDNDVLDVDRWARSNVLAGAMYNVRAKAGRSVSDAFWQTQPGMLPQYTGELMREIRTEIPQFTVGAFPAAFGGNTGSNNTASGISMERDAAMGRIGIFWRVLKEHHEDVAPLLVQEFVKNDMGPESITEQTEGGSFINISVDPAQIKKGQYQTFAESTEDYPTTWPQRQGLVMTLMGNPMFQGAMTKLANAEPLKRLLGFELEMPGEKGYKNAFEVIEQLIQQEPTPGQPQPVVDPMTGQPVMDPATGQPAVEVGPPTPSIMPGELDPFEVYLEACMDFDQSDIGKQLKNAKPPSPGYLNFLLYALELKKRLMPPPLPPEGGPSEPPPEGEPGAPEGQPPAPPGPA